MGPENGKKWKNIFAKYIIKLQIRYHTMSRYLEGYRHKNKKTSDEPSVGSSKFASKGQ